MCGAFKIFNHLFVDALTDYFDVPNIQANKTGNWANCGSEIEIILNDGSDNQLQTATWWLLLDNKGGQLKPSKYTSFNSRWRDGFSRANQKPFKQSRCIIPARGFVEGMNKKYHYLEPIKQAVAFGGLYKTWTNDAGDTITSCSVITIDPHPKFENIHKKAMPLMLPVDDANLLDTWLDPNIQDTNIFLPYMIPELRTDIEVTPLQKWRSFEPADEPFVIDADF